MAERYLLDTDLIVEYLRGRQPAVAFIEDLGGALFLSVVTVAELYTGARDALEERTLEQFFLAFEVVPATGEIARQAGRFRRAYRQSHGTGLGDALIAATAAAVEATVLTFKARHFPMVKARVPYERT